MIRILRGRLRNRFAYFFGLPGFKQHPMRTVLRTLSWKIKCTLGIPGNVRVPAWNARLILPPEWHGAGATLFYAVREAYEPELTYLNRFIKEGETFVDAGANCGVYTICAASIVGPRGLVLAFEPGPQVFATLRRSVELNGYRHVRLFESGLSETGGKGQLFTHPHGASSFSLGRPLGGNGESFSIRLQTLDEVLAAEHIEKVHCIKMDVEGAEELILRGAVRLFERCRPRVIFEINPNAIAALQLKTDGAWRFLEDRGYRFFNLDTAGVLKELPAPPGAENVIALPHDSA
jgi:FkbM family methyltransferase